MNTLNKKSQEGNSNIITINSVTEKRRKVREKNDQSHTFSYSSFQILQKALHNQTKHPHHSESSELKRFKKYARAIQPH
jgi:hypothetical protein